ncbi:hypothetical protein FJ251_02685 [bacterium]|nr:hypothetical protein [bacterium]
MPIYRLAIRIALGALALWLGLWPACDAVTGLAARSQIALPQVAAEPSGCCSEEPPAEPTCAAAARHCAAAEAAPPGAGCAHAKTTGPDAEGACTGTKAARCGQCFCLGGLVLFATVCLTIDPDLAPVGTLPAASEASASRHPRPLLRPPIVPPPIAA